MVSTERVRYYRTIEYSIIELFNRNETVEAIFYFKYPRDANVYDPITQEEMNTLQAANIPAGTTFPEAPLPRKESVSGEKVWRSDDGKFYIDLGTIPAGYSRVRRCSNR
jgi:hypothetical protein